MEVNTTGGLHGDFFTETVVGRHSTGEVNDFRRCKQCKTGSSYHYLLAAGTTIQCPHCGFVSLHVRI
jgi:hypothetical protein